MLKLLLLDYSVHARRSLIWAKLLYLLLKIMKIVKFDYSSHTRVSWNWAKPFNQFLLKIVFLRFFKNIPLFLGHLLWLRYSAIIWFCSMLIISYPTYGTEYNLASLNKIHARFIYIILFALFHYAIIYNQASLTRSMQNS